MPTRNEARWRYPAGAVQLLIGVFFLAYGILQGVEESSRSGILLIGLGLVVAGMSAWATAAAIRFARLLFWLGGMLVLIGSGLVLLTPDA